MIKPFLTLTYFHLGETLILTPKSFLFMILMATFCPVRMWRPNLTLAKPPEKTHVLKESHIGKDITTQWVISTDVNVT